MTDALIAVSSCLRHAGTIFFLQAPRIGQPFDVILHPLSVGLVLDFDVFILNLVKIE